MDSYLITSISFCAKLGTPLSLWVYHLFASPSTAPLSLPSVFCIQIALFDTLLCACAFTESIEMSSGSQKLIARGGQNMAWGPDLAHGGTCQLIGSSLQLSLWHSVWGQVQPCSASARVHWLSPCHRTQLLAWLLPVRLELPGCCFAPCASSSGSCPAALLQAQRKLQLGGSCPSMKGSGSRSWLPFTHSFRPVQVAKWVEGSWESWSQSPVCWSILPTWNGTAREERAAIGGEGVQQHPGNCSCTWSSPTRSCMHWLGLVWGAQAEAWCGLPQWKLPGLSPMPSTAGAAVNCTDWASSAACALCSLFPPLTTGRLLGPSAQAAPTPHTHAHVPPTCPPHPATGYRSLRNPTL
ncbi:uncharacterized protein LOC112551707 [Alligator sinensis]|uniref:Uncharacterized protein LOC112551707 n=1 Tax=Alligator sinensis TaxID=38654 RepID=A0A3Q0HIB0_ALLSI|nr:uncharacterized protein LOC112551707 [Alligator sinensis]